MVTQIIHTVLHSATNIPKNETVLLCKHLYEKAREAFLIKTSWLHHSDLFMLLFIITVSQLMMMTIGDDDKG